MDFTRVDTEVEAHEVVENWSVELHMDGLFAINHHGVWFYLRVQGNMYATPTFLAHEMFVGCTFM
jgi:hypothetical protein